MPCESSSNNCNNNDCLYESLCENVNSTIVCYTEGGCFSGLLVSVSCECIKVITCGRRSGCGPTCGTDYGKVTVIPIEKITAVTFCNTGQ